MSVGNPKHKVLFICDHFPPSTVGGGGMRTVVNTIERLGDEFEFSVITRNPAVLTGSNLDSSRWVDAIGAKVYYLGRDEISQARLQALIADVAPDAIYLNSLFSRLTIAVLASARKRAIFPQIIIAPCGELLSAALGSKFLKKKLFLIAARALGLFKDVKWKASTDGERTAIIEHVGGYADVTVAADLPQRFRNVHAAETSDKIPGVLRLAYLSRIDNHKNLLFLIEAVNSVGGDIHLDVYGDIHDERYHSICVDKAKNNRAITFKGPIDNALVPVTLSQYDFLALPTKGENFGHVILEALVARCPPIISDQTPWNDIETAGAGMVRTLDFDTWQKCLSECVAMTNEQHRKMKAGSKMFAESFLQNEEIEKETRELLRRACSG